MMWVIPSGLMSKSGKEENECLESSYVGETIQLKKNHVLLYHANQQDS